MRLECVDGLGKRQELLTELGDKCLGGPGACFAEGADGASADIVGHALEHIHWFYEDYPEPSTSTQQRPFFVWEDTNGVEFASTTTQRTIATAYSTNADGNQRYSNNNGYVLVIPQETNGSTMMCFRLKSTGDLVHRVALPATDYDAGKRYTYDIRFGRTQATVKLTIAEWNELKSSQDIPL